MAVSVEGKMVARVRNTLKNDAAVSALVGDRVYDSHISTIYQPEYPAISLTMLDASPMVNLPPAIDGLLQLDIWVKEYDANRGNVKEDLYTIMDAVRAAIHLPQAGYDSASGLTLLELRETSSGAILNVPDTNLWHLSKRFVIRGL